MLITVNLTVDLSVLKNNLKALKRMTRASVCAVVKADAYGHGIKVVKSLSDADEFAVADISEAYELKELTDKPVNILSAPDKTAKRSYPAGVYPTVATAHDVDYVAGFGAKAVNVKVNSGMNRYGVNPSEFESLLFYLKRSELKIKSVFSHIYDLSAAQNQFDTFMICVKPFKDYIPQMHMLSSNFTVLPEYMSLDMVRAGIVLYGYGHECVHSAVTLTCGVTQVREVNEYDNIGYGISLSGKKRKIAVLGAGYADGIRRITNNSPRYVIIGENLCPVVGQICMDATMADISGLDVKAGDTAVLMGEGYGAESVAASYGTICYEVLTSVGKRVKREYVNG